MRLLEHFVNLTNPSAKLQYADEVWEILQKSYAKIGGFKSAASPEELISDSGLWKVVTRLGRVTAVSIYKDSFGRKSIASGTDGTPQGKADFFLIKDEDIKLKRAWSEVSGPLERIMEKSGAKKLPSKYASILTGKPILALNEDGYHYTRLIAGHPHEKIIYGSVNLTEKDVRKLKDLGVNLHDLEHLGK